MVPQNRNSKSGALAQLRALGLKPGTVFDVGVQRGTPELYSTFPESLHILIEPVAEQEQFLKQICAQLPLATYVIAAAAERCGKGTLRITKNHQYSGVIPEPTGSTDDATFEREVDLLTLDSLAQQGNVPGPVLLKIDVDGGELSVLKGASWLLKEKVAYAVIEATLFDQIHQVIDFMSKHDFVLYDMLDAIYRPLDGALWQVDLAFVPRNSPLRADTSYDRPEAMRHLRTGDIYKGA